ncbi:hypothetical protein GCM10020000_26920 [Streptomyces olivoverticillatus]
MKAPDGVDQTKPSDYTADAGDPGVRTELPRPLRGPLRATSGPPGRPAPTGPPHPLPGGVAALSVCRTGAAR